MSDKTQPLSKRSCQACHGTISALTQEEALDLLNMLPAGWKLNKQHHLEKEFTFPDFRHALNFTSLVGQVAESEGHHPDIYLSWGKVKLSIWTHKIDALTESDFILAAKSDAKYPTSCQEACF